VINIFKQNDTISLGEIEYFSRIKYIMHRKIRKRKRNNLRVESRYNNESIDHNKFWLKIII